MRTIGDRYLLERPASGSVFVARDRLLDRAVAVKLVPGDARAMARLSHPNLIQVFDAGVTGDGTRYVAMELVDGATLDRWLAERPREPAAILAVFRGVAEGLAAAHRAGLVHGDVRAERVIVGRDGRARLLGLGERAEEPSDAGTDRRAFFAALAAALGGEDAIPARLAPVDRFASMDEVAAALQPPRAGRRSLIAAGTIAVTLVGLGVVVAWPERAPAPPPGFTCGPNLQTYAVTGPGDTRGVRCVLDGRDVDGRPWLAWYGEGVRDGARYRHLGEGPLGGDATIVEITGNGEDSGERFDGTVRLGSAYADARPARIVLSGAIDETWVRTTGRHAGYTSAFRDPIRMCGPHLARYRSFTQWTDFWGESVRCLMPGGRTWLGAGHWHGNPHLHVGTSSFVDGEPGLVAADVCYERRAACGDVDHGGLVRTPRRFPGIGDGFEVTGSWPELLLPSARRHAARLHAVLVEGEPVTVAEVEAAVRQANDLLAPADLDLFFVADEAGPDVGRVSEEELPGYVKAIETDWPYKTVVVFRAGEVSGQRLAGRIRRPSE